MGTARPGATGRCSAAPTTAADIFERTVALIEVSPRDAYVVDLFRVEGGCDHARFLHSFHGQVEVSGLDLEPAEDYGHDTQMRAFRGQAEASPG